MGRIKSEIGIKAGNRAVKSKRFNKECNKVKSGIFGSVVWSHG